jgi:hypothetical protein
MAGVLFSCSTTTNLADFSKQKYTKKFHQKTKKYTDEIAHYANQTTNLENIDRYELTFNEETSNNNFKNLFKPQFKQLTTKKHSVKKLQNTKAVSITNNTMNNLEFNAADYSILNLRPVTKKELKQEIKNLAKKGGSSDLSLILAIVFLFLLYPISVILVGNSDDIRLNLILFLSGLLLIILGFILIPLVFIGYLALLAGWIHAIIVVVKNI